MRSPRRSIAATVSAAVVAISLPALAVLGAAGPASAAAPGQIRITEWAYNGSEFVELTNVGRGAQDMTGWSYSDSNRTPAPALTSVDLSAFGRVAPGESVILSEAAAAAFRTAWGLSDAVKVIGGNTVNLGRSDEINVYDGAGAQVDRLTYNDQGVDDVMGPRTDTSSAWVPEAALGLNTANAWVKSTSADAEASWENTALPAFFGSPGTSTLGGYDAALNNSPGGLIRITEWAYNGDEFFELTNIGQGEQDMTGWSYSDSTRTPAPALASLDLSAFGTVAAGESVMVSEVTAAAFRTGWGLPDTVKVIGGNAVNLGRSDEINVYDAADTLVDRLTYNDQGVGDVAGPRTDTSSAWVTAETLGKNVASGWVKSTQDDAEGSSAHADPLPTFFASPGTSNFGFASGTVEPADTIRINEVESNGDVVGDWVELTNTGTAAVDVSGWLLRDSGATNPTVTIPSGVVIAPGGFHAIYTEIPPPGFGLGTADSITLLEPDETPVDQFSWADGHAATTYGRCPDGTGDFRVTTVGTRGAPNACSPIRVNEIDTASTPDRVEIVNISASPIDIAGWVLKDSTDLSPTTLPAPSVVPAHGYLVVQPDAVLDGTDSVRLLDTTDALIDSASWDGDPVPTLGRCADGVGAFKLTAAATIGALNDCPGVQTTPWPGSQTVAFSDDEPTLGQDASGLAFDPYAAGTLWVAQNKLGTLWRMTKTGSTWGPAVGWAGGKTPKYADGTGAPDTEGVTIGPDGGVYLASERNNDTSGVSKNTVLRYAARTATGTTLSATDEWDINPLLPSLGANLGLEGITWVPDQFLVAGGFVDQSTGSTYAPSHYPSHGTGLYVVAVEGTGLLYVLALDQTAAVHETAHLVATVDPRLLTNAGPPGVMDVSFDPELQRFWAICDDSCNGTSVRLALTAGDIVVEHAYERPAGMPNLNNEGFALAPQSTCVAGAKEVVWADDGDDEGHSLRSGTFPCTVPPTPPVTKKTAVVSASATSVAYGQAASIPVSVSAVGVVPTGTVTVMSGATALGSAALANGSAVVTVPATALNPGTHTLTVAYGGDSAVDARTTTVTQTVVKAPATMAKPTVKPKRIVVRTTRARVTITVLADGVVPTGPVTIKGGGLKERTVTLGAEGRVVVKLRKFPTKGLKKLTITYLGNSYVEGTSTALNIRVRRAAG